jgi:3-deoxy-D-manno-octulosonate 8-phosphate phosphatase (KDO 8-P phosphatase)
MGDDLNDIRVLRRSGFAVAVPAAAPEVKRVVDYVTKRGGGSGAVRELAELILKATGKWKGVIEEYC